MKRRQILTRIATTGLAASGMVGLAAGADDAETCATPVEDDDCYASCGTSDTYCPDKCCFCYCY